MRFMKYSLRFETIPDDNDTEKWNSTNSSSLTTVALSSKRKWKSPTNAFKILIKKREEKRGNDVLKAQKAVAYQLKSYCMGMDNITDPQKMKKAPTFLEQFEPIERMKSTIGVAVSTTGGHIKADTVCFSLSTAEDTKIP